MRGDVKAIETIYKGIKFRSRLEARWAVFFDALNLAWDYETEGYDLGEHGKYLPDFIMNFPWVKNKFYVEVKPTFPTLIEMNKMGALCHGKEMQGSIIFGTLYQPRINTYSLKLLMKKINDSEKPIELETSEVFGNIVSGALMVHFSKDGFLLPDCEAFAYTGGNTSLGIWTYYINPEVTFDIGKELVPFKELSTLKGNRVLALGIPGSNNIVFNKIGRTVFHERLYCGNGVSYNNETLRRAYEKARSARFEFGEQG